VTNRNTFVANIFASNLMVCLQETYLFCGKRIPFFTILIRCRETKFFLSALWKFENARDNFCVLLPFTQFAINNTEKTPKQTISEINMEVKRRKIQVFLGKSDFIAS
jgi:hypothetical protein